MKFTKEDINVLLNLDPDVLDMYILGLRDDDVKELKASLNEMEGGGCCNDISPVYYERYRRAQRRKTDGMMSGEGVVGDILGIASPFTKYEWLVGVIDLLRDTDTVEDRIVLNSREQLMADMAKIAYMLPHKRPREFKGFKITKMSHLNQLRHVVYHNFATRETIIALRGTQPSNDPQGQDIVDDLAITNGTQRQRPRFVKSVQIGRALMNARPEHRIIVVGHSLSGSIASHLNQILNVEAYAFNAGASFKDIINRALVMTCANKGSGTPSHCSKMFQYHVKGDPISTVKMHGKRRVFANPHGLNVLKAHSISNFSRV